MAGACGRVWGRVAAVDVCGRGSAVVYRWRHAAGVGTCGRVWGHVAGCGGMWHGWWQGVGHVAGVWVYGRGQAYGMDGDM